MAQFGIGALLLVGVILVLPRLLERLEQRQLEEHHGALSCAAAR